MGEKPRYINVRGKLIDLSTPRIMGVINVTPDSFYAGSRHTGSLSLIERVREMIREGADFIDIGGYSSRPGATDITVEEEKDRVLGAIKLVADEFPDAVISVDTFRSEIAADAVLNCGASMINDISGGEADPGMFPLVEKLNVPYILMHMQGTPQNMHLNPQYEDVVSDIIRWMGAKIVRLNEAGVRDVIIDPGFGFGKTTDHNFEILSRLNEFSITGMPLMAGLSRKSMIWRSLGITPEEALNGTTVLNAFALMKGADILRVHDVREAAQAIRLYERLSKGRNI